MKNIKLNPILDFNSLQNGNIVYIPDLMQEKKYISFKWNAANFPHTDNFCNCIITNEKIDAIAITDFMLSYLKDNSFKLKSINIEPSDGTLVYALNPIYSSHFYIFYYDSTNPNHKKHFKNSLLFKNEYLLICAFDTLITELKQIIGHFQFDYSNIIKNMPKDGVNLYTTDLYYLSNSIKFNHKDSYHIYLVLNQLLFKTKNEAIETTKKILKYVN